MQSEDPTVTTERVRGGREAGRRMESEPRPASQQEVQSTQPPGAPKEQPETDLLSRTQGLAVETKPSKATAPAFSPGLSLASLLSPLPMHKHFCVPDLFKLFFPTLPFSAWQLLTLQGPHTSQILLPASCLCLSELLAGPQICMSGRLLSLTVSPPEHAAAGQVHLE